MGRVTGVLKLSTRLASLVARGIGKLTTAPAPVVARVAKRMGVPHILNPSELIKIARNNKFATLAILYELYGAGHELVEGVAQEDEEAKRIIEMFGFTPDAVDGTQNVMDIARFTDEFDIIRKAAVYVGSHERLMVIRQALALDNKVHELYLTARALKPLL